MKTALLLLALALPLAAEDWPQFLGPRRDGTCEAKNLAANWPAAGPQMLWKKNVGSGWSAPVVAKGRTVIFHREGGMEIVDCHDAATGKPIWTYKYACDFRDQFGKDDGPRGTPAIADGRVYTMGASGIVVATDLQSGEALWRLDTRAQYGADIGFFGLACSPLVHGKNLLINIGGKNNTGIIALDTASGKLRWRASADNTSYSSPTIAKLGGTKQALFFTRAGLESIDPATGKSLYKFPWRPAINASVNAATPLVSGNLVFISTSYSKGAALLAVKGGQTETVWARDGVMSNQYATCVLHEGHLYGFHGRADIGGCEKQIKPFDFHLNYALVLAVALQRRVPRVLFPCPRVLAVVDSAAVSLFQEAHLPLQLAAISSPYVSLSKMQQWLAYAEEGHAMHVQDPLEGRPMTRTC